MNPIAPLHPELTNPSTPPARQADLASAIERERQRGIYWARAADEQIRGVRITATVDPINAAIASSSVAVNTAVDRQSAFLNQGAVDLHINNVRWRSRRGRFTLAPSPSPLNAIVPAGGSLPIGVEFGTVAAPGRFGDSLSVETTEGITATPATQARAA